MSGSLLGAIATRLLVGFMRHSSNPSLRFTAPDRPPAGHLLQVFDARALPRHIRQNWLGTGR